MFCKASLITVALALVASASPIIKEEGVRIELPKRASLTTADGVFDHDAAIISTVRTINKHRQNLINLEANVGRQAFNSGAKILDLAVVPAHVEKRQSEKLTAQDQDEMWTGPITIGSNKQQFTIDFDTGSSDLWVPSSTSSSGRGKHTYKASSSSTGKKQSGTFSIRYGDGSTTSGPIYKDTVAVAGITAKSQAFSPVTTVSGTFAQSPADGILGMAFQSISQLNAAPFFQNAYSQGLVKNNAFSFKLAHTGPSSLYLGGTDTSLYTGDVEYHTVNGNGFWQTTGASATYNGKKVVSGFDAIIDSGTTIMYGPPAQVKQFYAQIKGAKLFDSQNGYYSFPCNNVPEIGFTWGGKTFTITADNLNLGQTSNGASTCVGSLAGVDIGLGDNTWLLGDAFMKNVYSVFDLDQSAVGFADLA